MADLISFDPAPPLQGDQVTICYEFPSPGPTQTTLRATFTPGPVVSDHDVDTAHPCVTIDVPGNATKLTVKDLDAYSNDASTVVVPA